LVGLAIPDFTALALAARHWLDAVANVRIASMARPVKSPPCCVLEDEMAFNSRLADLQAELESSHRHADHEQQYSKYFEVKSTPARGTKVVARKEVLAEAKRNHGYLALLSNEIKQAQEALEIYRNKDLVEKDFDNLKERLNLRHLAVSSAKSLDGELFVQFIAMIYLSYITRKMQENKNKLFKNHSMQEVLDEFDIIECYEVPGQRLQVGEITKRQIDLYTTIGVMQHVSLQ